MDTHIEVPNLVVIPATIKSPAMSTVLRDLYFAQAEVGGRLSREVTLAEQAEHEDLRSELTRVLMRPLVPALRCWPV
jgi:hypothetical protein